MKNSTDTSRRQFLGTSLKGVGALALAPIGMPAIIKSLGYSASEINGVTIGAITYSYRSMPDQSAEATLQYILDSGLSAVELMGDPAETFAGRPDNPVNRRAYFGLRRKARSDAGLSDSEKKEMEEMQAATEAFQKEVADWRASVSMDKFKEFKKMYKDAGVSVYGFKPSAFGKNSTDAEIDYGFRAAKAIGASHVTLEHPSDDAHTMKLGKMAAKHKIYVAYHGHTQQTPTFWDTALEQSKYNAMNIDIGHYVAAGDYNPLAILKKKHDRILSMHMKDRQTLANGQDNLPWGEGDTPLVEVLQLMRDQKYKFPGTVELEYQIPEGSNAVMEVKRCVDFCRKALEG